jgi:hypothetical protein
VKIYQLLVTYLKSGIMEESISYITEEFYFSTLEKAREQFEIEKHGIYNVIGLEIVEVELDNITEKRFKNIEE